MARRRLLSAIVYNSLYFLLYIFLIALLIITPADAIERSRRNRQFYNIWILIAAYVLVVVVVGFVYFTRLYINKTDLASIPKGWVPVEKGDVRSAVHKMIAAGLNRSASIAFDARPRLHECHEEREEGAQADMALTAKPVWGDIEHYGWASPNAPDLPNLEYSAVLSELPYLIEAKAVTLAPPGPTFGNDPPVPDADAIAMLQRDPNMDLRGYFGHLAAIGVLDMDVNITTFLSEYEFARFSTRPISNEHFKKLMHHFAEVLRIMQPLDPDAFDEGQYAADAVSLGSAEYITNSPDAISPTSPRTRYFAPSDSSSTHSSMRRRFRNSSASTWYVYRTAPQSVRSRMTGPSTHGLDLSRKSSTESYPQSRHHYAPSARPDNASLRSAAPSSSSGTSSGSVIRLATRHDSTELPYVLSLKETFNP